MEKLLLVGAGGFGRVVLGHVSDHFGCAFLDDGEVKSVDGVPVIGRIDEIASFFPEYKLLLVTIGNNKVRQFLYEKAESIGYTFPNIIYRHMYFHTLMSVLAA